MPSAVFSCVALICQALFFPDNDAGIKGSGKLRGSLLSRCLGFSYPGFAVSGVKLDFCHTSSEILTISI